MVNWFYNLIYSVRRRWWVTVMNRCFRKLEHRDFIYYINQFMSSKQVSMLKLSETPAQSRVSVLRKNVSVRPVNWKIVLGLEDKV